MHLLNQQRRGVQRDNDAALQTWMQARRPAERLVWVYTAPAHPEGSPRGFTGPLAATLTDGLDCLAVVSQSVDGRHWSLRVSEALPDVDIAALLETPALARWLTDAGGMPAPAASSCGKQSPSASWTGLWTCCWPCRAGISTGRCGRRSAGRALCGGGNLPVAGPRRPETGTGPQCMAAHAAGPVGLGHPLPAGPRRLEGAAPSAGRGPHALSAHRDRENGRWRRCAQRLHGPTSCRGHLLSGTVHRGRADALSETMLRSSPSAFAGSDGGSGTGMRTDSRFLRSLSLRADVRPWGPRRTLAQPARSTGGDGSPPPWGR